MACAIQHSAFSVPSSDLIPRKGLGLKLNSVSRFLPLTQIAKTKNLSTKRPLYIASVAKFGPLDSRSQRPKLRTSCRAYEADQSRPLDLNIEVPKSEAAQKVKISIYFATWWALNVVFNIYNKKVLNAYPYPWLTSTLSLAAGSLIMLLSWATRIAEAPKTDIEFWKNLFPVAVSFTHIIKSGEPAFSVLVSRFLLGETFPLPVYLSLLPIIGGCALAAVTELNFNMIGFMGAMISNLAFVFRNIFSQERNDWQVCERDELLRLLVYIVSSDPHAFCHCHGRPPDVGSRLAASYFPDWTEFCLVSYMSLDEISPLTFSIGNTMKRISVIVSSIIIFRTPVQPVNALGAAIAVLGTFIYSQAIRSRCDSGVNEAALHISMMRSGLVSVRIRERAALDLSLLENGVLESGFKIEALDMRFRVLETEMLGAER
nr:glucose-6-phosphate/phosphate translocator 2, chloroplastic-like [Ipomoea batatas]